MYKFKKIVLLFFPVFNSLILLAQVPSQLTLTNAQTGDAYACYDITLQSGFYSTGDFHAYTDPCGCSTSNNLLQNTGFECDPSSSGLADYWTMNTSSAAYNVSNTATDMHGGNRSQQFEITTLGDYCILRQEYTFLKGHTYRGSIWLKSPDNIQVEFIFRRAGDYRDVSAVRRITVGPQWQQVAITGGYEDDVPGFVGINFLSTGELYIDDALLTDITESVTNQPPSSLDPISASLFGIHLNELGSHNVWPDMNQGIIRFWDGGLGWGDIQPSSGVWEDTRLNYYLDHVTGHNPNAKIIYTFGYSPAWVTISNIAGSPPVMQKWKDFVTALAGECEGKILYYEMWNEINSSTFWTGTVTDLFEMTKEASIILKAIDPNIQIIAPNVTINGYPWLEEFLAMGGGDYVDIISYHNYQPKKPELSIPKIQAVKDIMQNYGVQNKPLWNTEGNVGKSSDDPNPQSPTEDEAIAAIARSYIVQWLYGVSNFNMYCYEGTVMGNSYAQLSQYSGTPRVLPLNPLPPALAYRVTTDWLIGSKVVSKTVVNSRWLVQLKLANNNDAFIVWDTELDSSSFTIPSQWSDSLLIRELDSSITLCSPCTSVTIGFKPILLELLPGSQRQDKIETKDIPNEPVEKTTKISSYPNPFFSTTTIMYQLGEGAKVNLSVYDLYGRKITELVNSIQEEGKYEMVFNAEGVSGGVYFIQLETNKNKMISKMILIK